MKKKNPKVTRLARQYTLTISTLSYYPQQDATFENPTRL